MRKMNLNKLDDFSKEELEQRIARIRLISIIYLVIIAILLAYFFYEYIQTGKVNLFIVFPIAMFFTPFMNYTYIRKIKKELDKRN